MTTPEALRVLIAHQNWRRFDGGPDEIGPPMIEPRIIGEAIDVAINVLQHVIPAAEDVIDRWDSPDWKRPATATYINVLRQAVRDGQ